MSRAPEGFGAIGAAAAFADGLARVRRAPWLVVGVWFSTILLALPLTLALRDQIAAHLGASLMAESAARGVNYDWWNEFLAQTSGAGLTFVPAILGFASVMKNISSIADQTPIPSSIAVALTMYMLLSMFLAGGIVDRLARDRTVGAAAFFSACGVYFFRFLRLGVIATVAYWALFGPYHRWLFDDVYSELTRDMTVERTAFAIRIALYAAFAVPLFVVNMLFDYAKIRAVVEDRRSMIGALAGAWRFIRRQPIAVWSVYALDTMLFLLVIGVYYLAAPSATAPNLVAVMIGQGYILLRVAVRLQFVASQVSLFQGRLAHAGYVARPVPKWPDSPAAAAIGPQ